MSFLGFLLLGLGAGALAKLILPGRQGGGWLATLALGVVGALLGGWLGGLIFNAPLGEFDPDVDRRHHGSGHRACRLRLHRRTPTCGLPVTPRGVRPVPVVDRGCPQALLAGGISQRSDTPRRTADHRQARVSQMVLLLG